MLKVLWRQLTGLQILNLHRYLPVSQNSTFLDTCSTIDSVAAPGRTSTCTASTIWPTKSSGIQSVSRCPESVAPTGCVYAVLTPRSHDAHKAAPISDAIRDRAQPTPDGRPTSREQTCGLWCHGLGNRTSSSRSHGFPTRDGAVMSLAGTISRSPN